MDIQTALSTTFSSAEEFTALDNLSGILDPELLNQAFEKSVSPPFVNVAYHSMLSFGL